MVSIVDEIGFEVRITKEKVEEHKYKDEIIRYYVNSFEFLLNGKNILENIILYKDKKIYANVDSLDYIADIIKEAVIKNEFRSIEFIEPDLVIHIMPSKYYYDFIHTVKIDYKEDDKLNDEFSLIFYIDSISLSEKTDGGYGYYNLNISLTVDKKALLEFADGIDKEYS